MRTNAHRPLYLQQEQIMELLKPIYLAGCKRSKTKEEILEQILLEYNYVQSSIKMELGDDARALNPDSRITRKKQG